MHVCVVGGTHIQCVNVTCNDSVGVGVHRNSNDGEFQIDNISGSWESGTSWGTCNKLLSCFISIGYGYA